MLLMETIFLSYTYRPHPDHEVFLDRLRRYVIRAIEAAGLRIIDGVDVGGRPLDAALEKRIEECDALVALITPQDDGSGAEANPAFVLSELQFARGQRKPTLRVLHHHLESRGLGAGDEYVPTTPGNEADVVIKLLNTIALWRREYGKVAMVQIGPDETVVGYDETRGDRCEFQLISRTTGFDSFAPATFLPEPGAAYAVLPKLREGDRVHLRIKRGDKVWKTRHPINPFVGGVNLEEQP